MTSPFVARFIFNKSFTE